MNEGLAGMSGNSTLIFHTHAYGYLAEALVARGHGELGVVARKRFPDGELYQRLGVEVSGRDVAIVGGTIDDSSTLELYDLACGVAKYGARNLTLVIPFFGYSTMERAVLPGEIVTAKTRARLFSAVPSAADGTHIVMLDLHVEGIAHYFEGDVHPIHVYARSVIARAIADVGGQDYVVGSTDAGRAKWVEAIANELGVAAGFVLKRRLASGQTEVIALSADVQGKTVVLYDDMIRTGSSLLHAAEAYRQAGAAKVAVVATHGVFPQGAVDRLREVVDSITVTDSHPRALEEAARSGGFVRVTTVAGLLGETLPRHGR